MQRENSAARRWDSRSATKGICPQNKGRMEFSQAREGGQFGRGRRTEAEKEKGGGVRSEVEVGSVGRWNSGSEFSKGRWQQGDGRKGKIGVGLTQAVRREWESGKAVDWEDGVEFWWGGGVGLAPRSVFRVEFVEGEGSPD